MKNHLIILLVLVTSYRVNFAQGIDSPYIFPITATNPKWKTFKSRSEMAEVLQIPPQQLKGMSTRALVSTCMNFPMFKDLYFFNHVQIGFNNLKTSFNGFGELLKREDAGKELFKIYLNTKPSAIKDFSGDSAKVEYSFYFVKLEMLLAQEDILAKLDSMELTTLANEASKKFSEKLITSEFSGFSISPSILILARILEKNKQLPLRTSPELLGSLKQFSQTGTADNLEFLNQVDSLQAKLK